MQMLTPFTDLTRNKISPLNHLSPKHVVIYYFLSEILKHNFIVLTNIDRRLTLLYSNCV